MSKTIALFLILGMTVSCQEKVNYLDSEFPGTKPRKYAEGIINLPDRFQQNLTMSPDGQEHYFTETNGNEWRYLRIFRVKSGSGDIETDIPEFVAEFEFENEWFIGEPMISPDNMNLFFVADYPPDLWQSRRLESGDWEKPFKLNVSTNMADWYPSITKNGSLFFTNGTMFKSTPGDGLYETRMKQEFLSGDIRDPFLDPDGDFIIYTQKKDPEQDETDLFLVTRDGDTWSPPKDLGPDINTNHIEFAPYVSPDRGYLFFSRRDRWENASYSDIYWVSFEVVGRKMGTDK